MLTTISDFKEVAKFANREPMLNMSVFDGKFAIFRGEILLAHNGLAFIVVDVYHDRECKNLMQESVKLMVQSLRLSDRMRTDYPTGEVVDYLKGSFSLSDEFMKAERIQDVTPALEKFADGKPLRILMTPYFRESMYGVSRSNLVNLMRV